MSEEITNNSGLGGTSFGSDKGDPKEFEIDSLIQETLAESKKLENEAKSKQESQSASSFKATPMRKPIEPAKNTEAKPNTTKEKSLPGYDATFKEYKIGDVVKGKVVKVDPAGVMVDIGYKAEGIILPGELSKKTVAVGDQISVFIENLESKEGYVVLSQSRAEYEDKWKTAYSAYKGRTVLEAKVTSAVKGGLVVDFDGIRGFIPASQVAKKSEDQLDSFVGKVLPIKILEIDRRQGKVVLSHKLAASEQKRFENSKLFDELEIGQVRKGKVSSIKRFGAFVDMGGVEGLIHITEMSWKRINDPSELLKVGDQIEVFVLGIDKSSRKISLGLKQLQPDPWVEANDLYKVGQIINGKISRIVKFGAFIELEKGLEGLCHISELAKKQPQRPEDIIKIGDNVSVKILRILPEEQKIGLSIKGAEAEKEKEKIKLAEQEKNKVTIEDVLKDKTDKQ